MSDHVYRQLDLVESLRDLLNNTLDVYLSSVANRTNQIMKVLTVVSTISLPAVVISSIFGMNVKGVPFLQRELWFRRRWRTDGGIDGSVAVDAEAVRLVLARPRPCAVLQRWD